MADASNKTNSKVDLVETTIKILQGLAIIIGIWATYTEFKKQNEEKKFQDEKDFKQTAKEFRKYFYQKQLEYYAEAAETTATLATENLRSEDYLKARKTFYRLFWGRLSIVEDKCVEEKMVQFESLLSLYEANSQQQIELISHCNKATTTGMITATQKQLQQASLRLAHDASSYTINIWVDSTERKNYNR